MKRFEDLETYKRSVVLRKEVFELVKTFPPEEKYRLADQLIRSTRKCAANISEGHGRFHWQENMQFHRIARGSLCESQDHLNVAQECGYIDLEVRDGLKSDIQITIKMINGYIKFLENQKKDNGRSNTKYQIPNT